MEHWFNQRMPQVILHLKQYYNENIMIHFCTELVPFHAYLAAIGRPLM